MSARPSPLLLACALGICCGEAAPGDGPLEVRVYGEAAARGLPAEALEDGWSIALERLTINLEGIEVGGVEIPASGAFELVGAPGEGRLVGHATAPGGALHGAAFSIAGFEISGAASKGGVVKRFDWAFPQTIAYTRCESVTHISEAGAGLQITVRAERLFHDSLVAAQPALRFERLAGADLDGDGLITKGELIVSDIGDYDPGSEGGVDDLWSWLAQLSQTLGGVNGDGFCDADPVH